jgi:hypothetical protein
MARDIFDGPRNEEGGDLSFLGTIVALSKPTIAIALEELGARKVKRRIN